MSYVLYHNSQERFHLHQKAGSNQLPLGESGQQGCVCLEQCLLLLFCFNPKCL